MNNNIRIKKATHEGVHHWMSQRVTAIANIFFTIWFMVSMIMIGTAHIENVRVWLSNPFNAIFLILMLINIFYHATLGIRVVLEDYVQCKATRFISQTAIVFASFVAVITGIFAIFHIYASVNFNY